MHDFQFTLGSLSIAFVPSSCHGRQSFLMVGRQIVMHLRIHLMSTVQTFMQGTHYVRHFARLILSLSQTNYINGMKVAKHDDVRTSGKS